MSYKWFCHALLPVLFVTIGLLWSVNICSGVPPGACGKM